MKFKQCNYFQYKSELPAQWKPGVKSMFDSTSFLHITHFSPYILKAKYIKITWILRQKGIFSSSEYTLFDCFNLRFIAMAEHN